MGLEEENDPMEMIGGDEDEEDASEFTIRLELGGDSRARRGDL
jgi:hypothetical protein